MYQLQPQFDFNYNRLFYTISNQMETKLVQVLIVPMLNQRKIQLIKEKFNCIYHYTTFSQSSDIDPEQDQILIMVINLTLQKYYIYTQRGLLINRIDFSHLREKYGSPQVCSSNGLSFLFRKVIFNKKDKFEDARYQLLTVFEFNENEIKHIKEFDLLDSMDRCYQNQLKQNNQDKANSKKFFELKNHNWMLQSRYGAQYLFAINNNNDICVQVKTKAQAHEEQPQPFEHKIPSCQDGQPCEHRQYFVYFQSGQMVNSAEQEFLFCPCGLNVKLNMNTQYIILFNKCKIKLLEFNQYMASDCPAAFKYKEIEFQIWEKDTDEISFQDVRCGSNQNILTIKCELKNSDQVQIVIWSIKDQTELGLYTVSKDCQIMWENYVGQPIICCPEKTILVRHKFETTCYDHSNFFQFNSKDKYRMISMQGHRFDYQNHNWILLRENLSLSFSYMSFVIRSQFIHLITQTIKNDEQNSIKQQYSYDHEAYNYIFNQSTFFLDKSIYVSNVEDIEQILRNLEQRDPISLTLLHYKCGESSPLSIALKHQNNRMIDLFLSFMSKIDLKASFKFKTLFPQLCQYQSFFEYLEHVPWQTVQMKNKYTLNIGNPLSDDIIKVAPSNSIYVDDHYFDKHMGEAEHEMSYPVDIYAIGIGWILRNEQNEGTSFLMTILATTNIDIYDNRYIKVIIEFMYQQYKSMIILIMVPIFVLNLGFIFLGQFLYERLHDPSNAEEFDNNLYLMRLSGSMSIIISLTRMFLSVMQDYKRHQLGFKEISKFNYIRLISIYVLVYFWIVGVKHSVTRYITCLVIIFNFINIFDYLKLIDGVAPFIRIILQILTDTQQFLLVCILSVIVVANLFYLVGQHQIDYDHVDESKIDYSTPLNAFWWSWNMALGLSGIQSFNEGSDTTKIVLMILFFICSFFIVILLLNLLIAIMGNTFNTNSSVSRLLLIGEHLEFVMYNWYLTPYVIKDKDRIQYLITAFNSANRVDQMNAMYEKLEDKMDLLSSRVHEKIKQVDDRQHDTYSKVLDSVNNVVKSCTNQHDQRLQRRFEDCNEQRQTTKLNLHLHRKKSQAGLE